MHGTKNIQVPTSIVVRLHYQQQPTNFVTDIIALSRWHCTYVWITQSRWVP